MSDFLKRLSRDPYAPIDGASVVSVDERGNGYDYRGQLIAPAYVQPEQTWGETALGVATAPARLATALAGSLSPYGSKGWQVPPIINEGVDALTAVGDAYTGKMAPEDINSRALGMASFMMAGGGPALALERSLPQAGVSLGDKVMAKYLDWKHPDDPSALDKSSARLAWGYGADLNTNDVLQRYSPLETRAGELFGEPELSNLTKYQTELLNKLASDDAHYADLNRRSMETYGVGYEGLNREQTRHIRDGIEPPKPRPNFDVIDGGLYANSDSRPALLAGGQDQAEEGYADGGRVGDLPRPYSIARSMVGQREGRGNDLLNRFLNGDTAGMTSAEYAWCSRFVKQAAAKAGVDVSGATDMARSWLKVGQPVDKPAVGDVVVLSRGNPNSQYGHVGFYEGTDANGNVRILSGNHNNAVASGSYPASRVLGYRRLEGQPEAYDPATGQQGLKPLAMMDGVGREVPALPAPTPEPSQVADQPKPSFDFTKLASLFAEPEPAQAPQVNFTPIQAFQPQGSPIQASTPYRGTFAHGGQVRGLPDQSEPIHAGPLHSTVPGRTDHLPITVAAGSFVLPADIVSSLGEGNTNAGMEAVSEMFPLPPVRRADGGRVPIAAAGGEYVIAPETVAALGNGDMETGHELLDQFVRRTRAQNIQRLRALPGPEK